MYVCMKWLLFRVSDGLMCHVCMLYIAIENFIQSGEQFMRVTTKLSQFLMLSLYISADECRSEVKHLMTYISKICHFPNDNKVTLLFCHLCALVASYILQVVLFTTIIYRLNRIFVCGVGVRF